MNRRTALKLMGMGAVAAATPVEAEVSDFLERNWREMASNYKFADWLRENVPLHYGAKIAVVGTPKSGRTNLLAMLLCHFATELSKVQGEGYKAAARDFLRMEFREATLNRDFHYGSCALQVTYTSDIVFVTRCLYDNQECKGEPIFDVFVAKNRWGEQGTLTFNIGRTSSYAVQTFVRHGRST
jgi:hypothetical protein